MPENTPDIAATLDALDRLHEAATPSPWQYRPEEYDDWGFVRGPGAIGDTWLVLVARSGREESYDEMAAHRVNGTDPYGGNAQFVTALRNAYPTLRAHIATLTERLAEAERERDAARMRLDAIVKTWPGMTDSTLRAIAYQLETPDHPKPISKEEIAKFLRHVGDKLRTIDAALASPAKPETKGEG
jgi:hypothetical protein